MSTPTYKNPFSLPPPSGYGGYQAYYDPPDFKYGDGNRYFSGGKSTDGSMWSVFGRRSARNDPLEPPTPPPTPPPQTGGETSGSGYQQAPSLLQQSYSAPVPSYNFTPSPWSIEDDERQARLKSALEGLMTERGEFEDRYLMGAARGGMESRAGVARKYFEDMLAKSLAQEGDIRGGAYLGETTAVAGHDDFLAQLMAGLEGSRMSALSGYNSNQLTAAMLPWQKLLAFGGITDQDYLGSETIENERIRY